jgi:hypothetical protein
MGSMAIALSGHAKIKPTTRRALNAALSAFPVPDLFLPARLRRASLVSLCRALPFHQLQVQDENAVEDGYEQ